jgi:DNA-binding Xre family transcriptional regulator
MKTLKAMRENSALGIRDLASAAGISPNTLFRAEKGLPVRPSSKRKICKALKCRPEDIEW